MTDIHLATQLTAINSKLDALSSLVSNHLRHHEGVSWLFGLIIVGLIVKWIWATIPHTGRKS